MPQLALLSVFLAYVPLSFVRFGFADDYAMLMIHGFRKVNPFLIGDGRPIGGLIAAFLYSIFDTVSSGAVLRSIGLAEFLVCLYLIQRAIDLIGLERLWGAFVVVLFAASPTVQNWVVWSVSAWQFPALILGLAAFFPWQQSVAADGGVRPYRVAAFVALQVAAMLIYQPFALAAWPLIMLSQFVDRESPGSLRKMLLSAMSFGLMLIVTLMITRLLIALVIPPYSHDRTAVITLSALPQKIIWFFSNPVLFVFSYVRDVKSPIIYIPALSVLAVGLAFEARRISTFLWLATIGLAALIMTAVPSLAPAEYTPVRTDVGIALFACVTLAFACRAIFARFSRYRSIYPYAIGLVLLFLIGHAGLHVFVYTARAQAAELAVVEETLAHADLRPGNPVVLVGPPEGTSLLKKGCEVVMISCAGSAVRHALPNMVRLWLRANGRDVKAGELFFARDPADKMVFSFEPDRSAMVPTPAGAAFLDFRTQVLAVSAALRR